MSATKNAAAKCLLLPEERHKKHAVHEMNQLFKQHAKQKLRNVHQLYLLLSIHRACTIARRTKSTLCHNTPRSSGCCCTLTCPDDVTKWCWLKSTSSEGFCCPRYSDKTSHRNLPVNRSATVCQLHRSCRADFRLEQPPYSHCMPSFITCFGHLSAPGSCR